MTNHPRCPNGPLDDSCKRPLWMIRVPHSRQSLKSYGADERCVVDGLYITTGRSRTSLGRRDWLPLLDLSFGSYNGKG